MTEDYVSRLCSDAHRSVQRQKLHETRLEALNLRCFADKAFNFLGESGFYHLSGKLLN